MSAYDNLNLDAVKNIRLHAENNAKIIDGIVEDIIKPYCEDLDAYVTFVASCLKQGERPPSVAELEDFCMNLGAQIYFAGGMCENLGVRDDISKAIYKEAFNNARDGAKGTVQDKTTQAELQSQQEQLTNICFNRAYRIMKSKVDAAQELMSSCKKVLSHRIQEEQLTHMMSGE